MPKEELIKELILFKKVYGKKLKETINKLDIFEDSGKQTEELRQEIIRETINLIYSVPGKGIFFYPILCKLT